MAIQKEKYLPNFRRCFIPDPGYTLVDVDLSGADAGVVAWEAEDPELKEAYNKGIKLHPKNYEMLCGKPFNSERDKRIKPPGWNYPPYDAMKRFVHGTHYGASARTIAVTLGWRVADAQSRQENYFRHHPGVKAWHRRIEFEVQTRRRVANPFGYRIVYFDRPDQLLPQALAWIPQSTVGILSERGAVRLKRYFPYVHVLNQVHDSVVFQLPHHKFNTGTLHLIHEVIQQPIPYPEPLVLNWSISASRKSWADCNNYTWDGIAA